MSDIYLDDSETENYSDFGSEDSYNSEDNEFLAYHDAHIQAQVRTYLQKVQKKKDEAELRVQAMQERTDRQAVEQVRQQQIQLLGGCEILFSRVNSNLKALRFEPYLAEEQFRLYAWREDFFHSKFPEDSWFTDGGDDSHSFDTVPYQITKLWEELVSVACCPDREADGKVYLANDELISHKVKLRYDKSLLELSEYYLDRHSLEEEGLSFSDMTHMIAAVFNSGPPKLEELALKTCRVHCLDMGEVPVSLQKKAENGFWNNQDFSPPNNLSSEGLEKFNSLKHLYLTGEWS